MCRNNLARFSISANQIATSGKQSLYIHVSVGVSSLVLAGVTLFLKATALGLFFKPVFFNRVSWKWETCYSRNVNVDNKLWSYLCCCSTCSCIWNWDVPSLKISPRNTDSRLWRTSGNCKNSSSSETSPIVTWSSYSNVS